MTKSELIELLSRRQTQLAYRDVELAVKTILEKGLDQQHDEQRAFDALSDTYTCQGRFSRDTRKLLTH